MEMIRQIKVAKDVAVKGGDDAHRTVRRATSRIGNHSVGRNQPHPARDRATLAAAPQMLVVARCSRQRTSLNSRSHHWTTEEPTAINVPRSEVGHTGPTWGTGVLYGCSVRLDSVPSPVSHAQSGVER